ncbi:short-chain dehydrogenase/reductase family protein [Monosiga brevicollis MX1]|uniref:Short-chain dehydrogenase/reductase family protein n=1 Tax=Monosiga brevicollis TaxID=81824 RepID=A9UNM6_MONBE|nr:short-chain dehydrogenase/reductase family protein [Monosiga brevicollis MX1]EDQ92728.1 short-chain dehydrogenase/reductase family protein [Monosiga brevicollis MX1]|eukprot:XP_001742490.1 short-chain dehydrogenase/reductase family protein [Monosiga brevicollis MX1]
MDTHVQQGHQAAREEVELQKRIDRRDQASDKSGESQPPQTGARDYPTNPLPEQHQEKPGIESKLEPRPMFEAPFYKGSGKLQDKVALITGADSGIGRAVAVLFAREGADVAIGYLNEHEDAQETKDVVEKEGRRAILLPGDVADRGYGEDAVKRVLEEYGRLDILVNNAAFQEHANDLADLSQEHFDRTIKTNIYGMYNMTKAAAPHLAPRGCIINSGSVCGIDGSANKMDYALTKGAMHAFTIATAQNLLPRSIRVNAVAIGPVWTPFNPADAPAEKIEQFGAKSPMGRPAQPEEISPAYVYLASEQMSSYVTGTVMAVSGGMTH